MNGPSSINFLVDQGGGRGTVCFLPAFPTMEKKNPDDLFHEAWFAILPWIERSFDARFLEKAGSCGLQILTHSSKTYCHTSEKKVPQLKPNHIMFGHSIFSGIFVYLSL